MMSTVDRQQVLVWWANAEFVHRDLELSGDSYGLLAPDAGQGLSEPSRLARIILRLALHSSGAADLAREPIGRSNAGRPYFDRPGCPDFNISHSAGHVAVAIAFNGPVGIDIEQIRPLKMSAERQQRIADQAVQHGLILETENSNVRDAADFLSMWTRLEAVAKARGDGIGAVLSELKTPPERGQGQLFATVGAEPVLVEPLSLADDFQAALVRSKQTHRPAIQHLDADSLRAMRAPKNRDRETVSPSARSR